MAVEIIPWVLMVWTVLTLELIGRMRRIGFISGLASQGLWLVFDWQVGAFGLMPLALILGWRYIAAYRRWGKVLA
jgi:hypothetical protein